MNTRTIVRLAFLAFVLCFAVGTVHADTIMLASVGTPTDPGQTNANGNTIALNPDPVWAAALPGSSWVSYTDKADQRNGSSYFEVPNGTNVAFYDTFNVAGTVTGGSLTVMAEDTASVYENGTLLVSDATSTGNGYAACSDFAIGCLSGTALTINLPGNLFVTGQDTLQFDVKQVAGSSYSLDYSGSIRLLNRRQILRLRASLALSGCSAAGFFLSRQGFAKSSFR
jgi:hypothetical protein